MTAALALLALLAPQDGDSVLDWKSLADLPLKLERVHFGTALMFHVDWKVDIPMTSGASVYQIDEIENGGNHIAPSIGLDLNKIDLRAEVFSDRDFEGFGTQSSPGTASAEFDGSLRLIRIEAAFRALGFVVGGGSGPPDFDLYFQPTVELSWAELNIKEARSSLGTETADPILNETAWTWGIGGRVTAQLTQGSVRIGFEAAWTFAGGRLGGSLDLERRSEAYVGIRISLLPTKE